jgi:hypothetical protein
MAVQSILHQGRHQGLAEPVEPSQFLQARAQALLVELEGRFILELAVEVALFLEGALQTVELLL